MISDIVQGSSNHVSAEGSLMQEQRDIFFGNVVGLSNTHNTVWISPIIYASQFPHLDPGQKEGGSKVLTYPLLMGYYLPRLFTIH
jgi:hypothetical protein